MHWAQWRQALPPPSLWHARLPATVCGLVPVLRAHSQVAGGVEDKGISFSLATGQGTPAASGRTTRSSAAAASTSQGGYITPSRVMLTNCETKMNLLTPDHPTSMYRADIETQKIVSTWAFNKVRGVQRSALGQCRPQRAGVHQVQPPAAPQNLLPRSRAPSCCRTGRTSRSGTLCTTTSQRS